MPNAAPIHKPESTRDPNTWLNDIAEDEDIDQQWRDLDPSDLYGDDRRRFDR